MKEASKRGGLQNYSGGLKLSGDGVANRNGVLGLCPIRNDDRDRPDPYGRDHDRGRGHL